MFVDVDVVDELAEVLEIGSDESDEDIEIKQESEGPTEGAKEETKEED